MPAGRFITFEGGEGSGKTTQIRLLLRAFEAAGLSVISTREPGGTNGAEDIRNLLVRGDGEKWDDVAELLLFYAARREHVQKRIKPSLDAGIHVICDRFADSSRIYQGFGKGLGEGYIRALHQLSLGHFQPDITLWLDMDVETGLSRTQNRREGSGENRFENLKREFHERVREGFDWLAKQEPQRITRIQAQQPVEAVHGDIIHAINKRLGLTLRPQES